MSKDKDEHFEYGIGDLADALNIGEAAVRIKLRNAGAKKNAAGGTRYGWKTKAELKEMVDKLKSTPSTPIPADERKGAKKKAPAKEKAAPAKEKDKTSAKGKKDKATKKAA